MNKFKVTFKSFDKSSSLELKGIAIILMMLHHNFRTTGLFEKYDVSFVPFSQELVVNIADMSKICVSIFAFISGYGLYLVYKNNNILPTKWVTTQYIKTFSGYWYIYILSSLVCEFLNGRFTSIFLQTNIWDAMVNITIDFLGLANLFSTHTLNGSWWYMSAAFIFILITPLLVKYEENIGLIVIGVIVFLRIVFGGAGDEIFPGNNAVYAFLTPFMFGMLFAKEKYIEKIINSKHKALRFIIEIVLLIIAYKVYFNISTKYYWEIKWGLIPLLVILFFVEYVNCIPGIKQILYFLGKHSMNIFLVHIFIKANYLSDFIYSWKHFIPITIVLLLVSLFVSLIIEQMKDIMKYNWLIQQLCKKVL